MMKIIKMLIKRNGMYQWLGISKIKYGVATNAITISNANSSIDTNIDLIAVPYHTCCCQESPEPKIRMTALLKHEIVARKY